MLASWSPVEPEDRMSTTGQMWLWPTLLPAIAFLSQNMCVWPALRFLGVVALLLLSASLLTICHWLDTEP